MFRFGSQPAVYTVAQRNVRGVVNIKHIIDLDKARNVARILSTCKACYATIDPGMFDENTIPLIPWEIWTNGSQLLEGR